MECLKVRRLLPWPPKAGLFADFAHAVDRVLEAEEQEHRARPDRFSDGLWKCRAEAWRRRHHTKALGSTAGKLQRAVGRRMVELEARMRRREAPSGASELRELLAVEVEVWTSELQQLADPLVWAADGSLLQDVGPVRSGCFLLGDAHLQKLTGRALEQKLEELHDMSGWYIPNHPADVPRALAVGVPILDAICSQMRLLDAWASRQETREATEQWCSRSFASAMLSVSTLQQRSRGSSSEPLALPARLDEGRARSRGGSGAGRCRASRPPSAPSPRPPAPLAKASVNPAAFWSPPPPPPVGPFSIAPVPPPAPPAPPPM
ncbi:unnamed protein product [Durusdinium trenchii]|uniref:Uncharacterized protein n=1 Tax=Durusdinium trenchii TaxID=1381693 RepID=A0ABP0KL08_9DINO